MRFGALHSMPHHAAADPRGAGTKGCAVRDLLCQPHDKSGVSGSMSAVCASGRGLALRQGLRAGAGFVELGVMATQAKSETDPTGSFSNAPAEEWFTPLRFGVFLAVALFACFPEVWLGTRSFFFRDYGVLGYPFLFHARESFWQGELPLWNPLSNCGAPFLAQWGTMVLYPFSLIYLVGPMPWSLSVFCYGHLVLAGVGMYRLAQRWVGDGLAASMAGTAFVFSGFMFACLIWPNYLVALGWMPWVVLLAERAWREGKGRVVGAALVAAMQLLAGVPEVVLLTWVVIGGLWLLELGQSGKRKAESGNEPARGAVFWRLVVVVLLAAGLVAAQLLPFFDLLGHSQREPGAVSMKWAMPGWGWANLLVPLFHAFETPQGQFFQWGQEFMSSYYLGAGVLVLAGLALARKREGRVWMLGGLMVFSLVMALGDQTVVYGWFQKWVPVVGLARYPVKFVALPAFVVPLLAAWAVGARGEERGRGLGLVVGGAVALALMGGLVWFARAYPFRFDQWDVTFRNTLWRAGWMVLTLLLAGLAMRRREGAGWFFRLAGLGVLLVIAWDGATHSPRQNPTLPSAVFEPNLWAQASNAPAPRLGEGRVMISPAAEQALLRSSVKEHEKNFMVKRLAEWSNLNVLDRIPKVNGSSTLQVREQKQVETLLYGATNRLFDGLMDFLGVTQITAPGQVLDWAGRTNSLPLVTAGQRPVFMDGTNALTVLAADDFNPRETVCLPREIEDQVVSRDRTEARVLASKVRAPRLEFAVEAAGPSLVVIAQSYYQAWEAEVDGRLVPLWRANHAFQALEVPAGRHEVVVSYRDRSFSAGAAVSLATLLSCGLYEMRRRRLAAQ